MEDFSREPAITQAGKKRKRTEAPEGAGDGTFDDRRTARFTLYSDLAVEIPPGMSIRKIDCEEFYDSVLRKQEVQQYNSSLAYGDADHDDETQQHGHSPSRFYAESHDDAGEVRHAEVPLPASAYHGQPSSDDAGVRHETIDLDYGDPNMLAEWVARKKIKVEEGDSDLSSEPSADPHCPAEDEARSHGEGAMAVSHIADAWGRMTARPPRFYLQLEASQTLRLLTCPTPGSGVVLRELALHPRRHCPEMMVFVGVVTHADAAALHAELRGPLLDTADWADYDVEPRTWTPELRPALYGL
jgi:hypothetical protein